MSKRDDLFESEPPKEEKTVEGQGEDFFFEMKDDESLEADPPDEPLVDEPLGTQTVEPEKTKSGSRQRVLLLLLLVIVLLGAGYFFVGGLLFGPEPAPAPRVVKSQPQKLKVPERMLVQQEQKAVKEVVMPSEKVSGATAEEKTAPQEEAAIAVKAPVEKTAEPAPAERIEEKQTQAGVEPEAAETTLEESAVVAKATAAPDVVAEPKAEEKTEVAVAAVKAPYVLQIGAYVLEANMERTLDTVKSLGYEPFVIEGKKTVSMVRLRVGAYPEQIAREKLSEMQQMTPSAFLLHEGEQMALYAGSYYGLDRARVQADLLFQHEIHIDEEQVDIAIPIKTVRFGDFPDSAAAGIVAEKAKEAGLEAMIVKQS